MGYPDPEAPYGGPTPEYYQQQQQPPLQQGYGAPPPQGYSPTSGVVVVSAAGGQSPTAMRLVVAFIIAISGWAILFLGDLVADVNDVVVIGPALTILGVCVGIWALIAHTTAAVTMPNGVVLHQPADSFVTAGRVIGVIVLVVIGFYCFGIMMLIIAFSNL